MLIGKDGPSILIKWLPRIDSVIAQMGTNTVNEDDSKISRKICIYHAMSYYNDRLSILMRAARAHYKIDTMLLLFRIEYFRDDPSFRFSNSAAFVQYCRNQRQILLFGVGFYFGYGVICHDVCDSQQMLRDDEQCYCRI